MVKPFPILVAAAALLTACATDTAMYQQVRNQQFTKAPTLYSTRSSILASGKWRFLLMPGEYLPTSAPNYSQLYTLRELAAAFRTLRPGTQVEWSDDPPNAWSYPPESLQQRVKDPARQAGLTIEINPVVIE